MKKTKEQLQKELQQIEELEFNELIEKNYPKFKALEGKCFKLKNNYSLPQKKNDYWFLYIKILKIEKKDLYRSKEVVLSYFNGWSFEQDKYNIININPNYNTHVHLLSQENEITEEEFNLAWLKLLNKINKISINHG